MTPDDSAKSDRGMEWFVPQYGSPKFRRAIGLLFLHYTAMVMSYSVIGSMLAVDLHWDRVGAIAVIYFLGQVIGAHALDALGSKSNQPWGNAFGKRSLWLMAGGALAAAYLIGAYYIVRFVPNLVVIALIEGFFVFA